MISCDKVSKYFGDFCAVNNVSFEINRGEIVGFLGQNGAGKTTLMRLLTTYLSPSAGAIKINSIDVKNSSLLVRQKIGYLPENPPLYENMNVQDYLTYAAQLKNVEHKKIKVEVERVLSECNLSKVKDQTIQTLSKGYKQRVGIAQAILNDPPVLILDEPTSGLDPVQIKQVRKLIKSFEHKKTILLSTHILPEIEQMAKRVIMIRAGKIIVDNYIEKLITAEEDRVLVCIKGMESRIHEAVEHTEGIRLINSIATDDVLSLELGVKKELEHFNGFIENVFKVHGRILEIKEQRSTLEEIFLNLHKN